MLQIRFFTHILIIIGLKYAFSDEANIGRTVRQLHQYPSQRTRGFGYNVQDEAQQSSHFRKEQRDLNGVVRGSYGLKDPNGSFRLVSYIADDKGFRVHISSNEHGVGQQNPASVSLTHFPQLRSTEADITSSEDPIRQFENKEKGSSSNDQEWPSNYDFYVPLKQTLGNSEELSKKLKPLDLGKHLFEAGFYDESTITKQDTSRPSVAYNTNSFRNKHQTDPGMQDLHTDSFKPFESDNRKSWPEIPDVTPDFKSTMVSSTRIRENDNFPRHFISDTSKMFDESRGNNPFIKKSDQLPYGILNLLFNYPQ
ncbi:unnamed protein product, partial [Larinioides sclopetarius]